MARRSIVSEEDTTDIDLSPMIDCIFILLIFFIVTTVFVQEQGLQVNKPDAAASAPLEEVQNVVVEITGENRILMGDQEIGLSEVAERVRAGMIDADTPVVIRAHEAAEHGVFIAVWDAARRGGAQALSFSTVN